MEISSTRAPFLYLALRASRAAFDMKLFTVCHLHFLAAFPAWIAFKSWKQYLSSCFVLVADEAKGEQETPHGVFRVTVDVFFSCRNSLLFNCSFAKQADQRGVGFCVFRINCSFKPGELQCVVGLRCGGYGSAVTVTATFGMVAVAEVLKRLGKV